MRKITGLALNYIGIRFVLKRLIAPTPTRTGPIDYGLFVCVSVGPSICTTAVFRKLAYSPVELRSENGLGRKNLDKLTIYIFLYRILWGIQWWMLSIF